MERIEQVAGWKIKPGGKESMLRSLLRNNADSAASKYCNFYILDADIDLLIYAIRNENEEFIKHALKSLIFNVNMLSEIKIIKELLENLNEGRHIELCLNIIIYVDFGRWSHDYIEVLLNFINDLVNDNEDNKLLLTSNTIMALALCSEFLKRISKTVRIYKRK